MESSIILSCHVSSPGRIVDDTQSTASGTSSPFSSRPSSPVSSTDHNDETRTPGTSTPPSEEDLTDGVPFVYIPDMFTSIMSVEARVNPNYAKLKAERDAWIADAMNQDSTWAARNAKVDLAYLASAWAPDADEDLMRTIMDWNHWVFLFDDQFDEGHLRYDPVAAAEECNKNMEILEQGDEDLPGLIKQEDNPIQWVFQDIWHRLRKRSCMELQRHWKVTHRAYFDGLVRQAELAREGITADISVEEYMDLRTLTIGVYPAISLTEFGFGIKVPDEVFNHPSVQKCMRISAELAVLVNDITSYQKDLSLGVDLNIFQCLMTPPADCPASLAPQEKGYTGQQVMDAVGEMVHDCYRSWYLALAELPSWDEETDRAALKYVEACRNVALGNLHWSFRTGRYLGPVQGRELRNSRVLRLTPSENLDIEMVYACTNIPRK
ncbi:Presilphiperfolan-8-beta-ol synthase [Naviculisporaceae sp. PSN 640]